MTRLEDFVRLLAGSFDNRAQFEAMQQHGRQDFPYARHVNSCCNDRITDLPDGFQGIFLLEESYYRVGEKTHASPHLFLLTEVAEGIQLTSYEMPAGYTADTFTYANLRPLSYGELRPSARFTPALYREQAGVWEGGSVSMFTPKLKFTLFERFSEAGLEVSETMEMDGRRTFGYEEPILYKRTEA